MTKIKSPIEGSSNFSASAGHQMKMSEVPNLLQNIVDVEEETVDRRETLAATDKLILPNLNRLSKHSKISTL